MLRYLMACNLLTERVECTNAGIEEDHAVCINTLSYYICCPGKDDREGVFFLRV